MEKFSSLYMDSLNNNSASHPSLNHNSAPTTGGGGGGGAAVAAAAVAAAGVFPISAFSAFHLLRNYNYLMGPTPPPHHAIISKSAEAHRLTPPPLPLSSQPTPLSPKKPLDRLSPLTLDVGSANKSSFGYPHHHHHHLLTTPHHNLFGYHHHHHHHQQQQQQQTHQSALHLTPGDGSNSSLFDGCLSARRHRGEKKPIPDEQKDDKYYERRRRNNQAAKKSRDARKIREDQVALKATILEHENAILKAQVLTLREEASSLRQMLLQKKNIELNS